MIEISRAPRDIEHLFAIVTLKMMVMIQAGNLIESGRSRYLHNFQMAGFDQALQIAIDGSYSDSGKQLIGLRTHLIG